MRTTSQRKLLVTLDINSAYFEMRNGTLVKLVRKLKAVLVHTRIKQGDVLTARLLSKYGETQTNYLLTVMLVGHTSAGCEGISSDLLQNRQKIISEYSHPARWECYQAGY
jgi:hypothetical protein